LELNVKYISNKKKWKNFEGGLTNI